MVDGKLVAVEPFI